MSKKKTAPVETTDAETTTPVEADTEVTDAEIAEAIEFFAPTPVETATPTVEMANVRGAISSAISARVVAAPQQDKKWEVEEKALTSDTVAQYLADTGVDIGFVAKVGIYAVQKARKLAQFAVGGRSALDPATRMILKAAHNLAAQGEVFSPKMQLAALSTAVEAEGLPVTKLGGRGSYTDRTASAQSQTTRQALVAMGMATLNDGGTKCLKVDFGHPVVRQALGIVDEEVAKEGASE